MTRFFLTAHHKSLHANIFVVMSTPAKNWSEDYVLASNCSMGSPDLLGLKSNRAESIIVAKFWIKCLARIIEGVAKI